jgi:AraC-like DNA-binding protein
MRKFSSRYFLKLFYNGIFFGLLPSMVIGFSLYFYSHFIVIRNMREIIAQSRHQIQIRVEQTMRMQDRQLFNFLMDDETARLLEIPILMPDHFQVIEKVREKLNKLFIYDLGVDSYILVNLKNDWSLSVGGVSWIKGTPAQYYLENIPSEEGKGSWYADFNAKEDIIKNMSNRWMIPYTIKFSRSYPIYGPRIGYISISIPCAYYNGLLAADELAFDILLVNPNGDIVANKRGNLNGKYLKDSMFYSDLTELSLMKSNIGQDSSQADAGFIGKSNGPYLYSYARSAYNDWWFIYIADVNIVIKELNTLRNISSGIGIIVIIGVIVVASFRAQFFYKPVKRLYERLNIEKNEPNGSEIPKDEFVTMDTRIDALLKERTELEQRVLHHSQLEHELFARKLINGEISGSLLDENILFYSISSCPKSCRVILMQIESLEEMGYEKGDRNWLIGSIINTTTELIAGLLCFPPVADRDRIIMIIGSNMADTEFKLLLKSQLEILLESIRSTLYVDAIVCISENAVDYGMINKCYTQTDFIQKNLASYNQKDLLFVEDLREVPQNISSKDISLAEKIKEIAEHRYSEYLSIEIIAEEIQISPSRLRRIFKHTTGMAFSAWLTLRRMEAAKKMLEETDLQISDIAKKLTYQNSQNFIRAFHGCVGIAPGEYRKIKSI